MTLLGLPIGAWIGARFFVSKADGMVGGAMVLWYGVLGAIILLVISVILGRKLQGKSLPISAVTFALLAMAVYGTVAFNKRTTFLQEAGSNSAYTAAGKYTASMERLDLSDPFLFVKMEIDSHSRKWLQTGPAPKNETFTATLRAYQLLEIREALNNVALMPAEVLGNCNSDQGTATKRLSWHLIDAEISHDGPSLIKKGSVNTNEACLQEHSNISRALLLVERASRSPKATLRPFIN